VIFKLCPTLASFFILMEGTRNSGAGNVSNKTFKIDLKFETGNKWNDYNGKNIYLHLCLQQQILDWLEI